MKMIYKIAIIAVFVCLTIYLFKDYINNYEGFEGNNENNTQNTVNNTQNTVNNTQNTENNGISIGDVINGASEGASEEIGNEENNEEVDKCKSGDWWDEKPIKAIRSKLWGASYNLIYDDEGNINSPISIPINNPNSKSPPGCLSVSDSGWHETKQCVENDTTQRWKIVKINTKDDFVKAIEVGKESGGTVGFTYGYKIDDKFDYPFFIVVSAEYPSQALYYNGSALGVRPLGNYDDQKWDILDHRIKEPIATNEFNYYSKLTPELRTSPSSLDSGIQSAGVNGSQNLGNNPQAMAALLSNIMQAPNTNGAFAVKDGLKINIEMDEAIMSQLSDTGASANNNTANTTIEPFTNSVPIYPKNPMDIKVTLDYNSAKAPKPENNKATTNTSDETVAIQQIDIQGKLVTIGNTTMQANDGRKLCDDTACHPDMRDWDVKPYPCRACVPGEEETW
jgi:hypothetical protein